MYKMITWLCMPLLLAYSNSSGGDQNPNKQLPFQIILSVHRPAYLSPTPRAVETLLHTPIYREYAQPTRGRRKPLPSGDHLHIAYAYILLGIHSTSEREERTPAVETCILHTPISRVWSQYWLGFGRGSL
jgi:hypothetical protein